MKQVVPLMWLAVALLGAGGCGARPERDGAPQARQPESGTRHAVAELGSRSATAAVQAEAGEGRVTDAAKASPGKPRAPVEAGIVGQPALQSGVPGKVTLEVRPGVAVDALTVLVEGGASLTVVGQVNFRSGPLAAGEPVRFEIAVTPTSGGTGRLLALLTLETGQQKQARPVSLSLQVGGPVTAQAVAEKTAAPVVTDAAGEIVHSMPAETTVR